MATNYSSGQVATGINTRTDLGVQSKSCVYEITGALVIDDVIQMVKIPNGASVLETILSASDLDTGGSPLLTLDVGDDGDADRFIAASTIGQTGGVARANKLAASTSGVLTTGIPYTYSANNTIDIHVLADPATGASTGCLALSVIYAMDSL